MIREARINRTIHNIERAGASLGWTGWEIRGAQAASVLLFQDMPELQTDRDLEGCELRKFGKRVAEALRQRNAAAGYPRASVPEPPPSNLPAIPQ